jgi:hypothetical protein
MALDELDNPTLDGMNYDEKTRYAMRALGSALTSWPAGVYRVPRPLSPRSDRRAQRPLAFCAREECPDERLRQP